MSTELGETDYRRAGCERLLEAKTLLDREYFAGGVYLAGRAVESLLRALIWRFDPEIKAARKTLDAGHDLRELLDEVADLGVLNSDKRRDELSANVQYVARLWFNNLRFVATQKLKTHWWRVREISKKRTLKQAAYDYYNACSAIVKRCEVLCES